MKKEKKEVVTKPRNGIVMIIVAVIITVLVVGFGVYFWCQLKEYYAIEKLQKQVDILQTQLQQSNQDFDNSPAPILQKNKKSNLENKIKEMKNREGEVFKFDSENATYYGKATIVGYPIIKEKSEAFCAEETGDCKKYSYVYFKVLKSDSTIFFDYLNKLDGNSFEYDGAIGLGCLLDGKINYYNFSDELGSRESELDSVVTDKILKATKQDPIEIELEKLFSRTGHGAPTCSSLINYVRLVNEE